MDANPILVTSTPWEVTPSLNATESPSPEGLISRPMTTASDCVNFANAAPNARAIGSSNSSGARPRMSYALNTFARRSGMIGGITSF